MIALRPACALLAVLLLAACVDRERYPSLAARPIEGIMDQPVTPTIAAPVTADPDRAARIAALLAQAEGAGHDFDNARVEAERAVDAARGAARGDDRWLAAHQQLSRLETARVPVSHALADLDALAIAQADAAASGTASAEAEALASAHARVSAINDDEQAVIGKLSQALGG
jgi:hypothetical protein